MQALKYTVGDWQEVAAVRRFIDADRRTGSATVDRFIYPGSPIQISPSQSFSNLALYSIPYIGDSGSFLFRFSCSPGVATSSQDLPT